MRFRWRLAFETARVTSICALHYSSRYLMSLSTLTFGERFSGLAKLSWIARWSNGPASGLATHPSRQLRWKYWRLNQISLWTCSSVEIVTKPSSTRVSSTKATRATWTAIFRCCSIWTVWDTWCFPLVESPRGGFPPRSRTSSTG